ncbi:MAG: cupin-like domain-containing protein [Oceanospirillaceae bacterium]|nr:cupin-like domain-containing protein [Oceanospirillaceae bacterium]
MQSLATQLKQPEANSGIEYHWCKWIFDNLLNGCTPESMEKTITAGTAKNKSALIAEVYRVANDPYLQAAKEMKLTQEKRNWLLDTCDKLAALDQRYSTQLEKRAVPTFDEFVREYYSKHLPVVLTGGFDHWPAREKWPPSYFSERVGSKQVEVQFNRSQDRQYERNSRRYKQKMRMDEFCRLVVEGGESNDYYLTANNNQASLSELALLFEDVGDFGKGYRIPATIKTRSHLWFGPKGAFTPLHHDLTNNMLVQVYGRKKLTLIPAFQVSHLYNDTHVYSATDFPEIDVKRFPKMKNVTQIEMILNPGEAVFIPIGWWHCVESLDVSISVSFTDFNVKNDFFVNFPRVML